MAFWEPVSSWLAKQVLNRVIDSRRDRLQRRRDLLQKMMGEAPVIFEGAIGEGKNGHPLLGEASAVFAGCTPVTDALQKLDQERGSRERVKDNLITSLKAMGHDVGWKLDYCNDDFILRPRANSADRTSVD